MRTVVFADTSALLPLLNADDDDYGMALSAWDRLEQKRARIVTSNYVLLETVALAQKRLGFDAVRDFLENIVPLFEVEWVDRDIHDAAARELVAVRRRKLSLVDFVSFHVMRRLGVQLALAFDSHFGEHGFDYVSARH